jgi:hypothetical protein
MAGVQEVEVVVGHPERTNLRIGDVFLKIYSNQTRSDIESNQTRSDIEVEAMAMAPVPRPTFSGQVSPQHTADQLHDR